MSVAMWQYIICPRGTCGAYLYTWHKLAQLYTSYIFYVYVAHVGSICTHVNYMRPTYKHVNHMGAMLAT